MNTDLIKNKSETVIHRAGWVLVKPDMLLPDGYVCVENGIITETGQGRVKSCGRVVDHGNGVLMAGLVNAHTHLELSALKGAVSFEKGFRPWVSELIRKREAAGDDNLLKGVESGIAELKTSGCVCAGEISTLGISGDMLRASGLNGVFFREYLGDKPSEPVGECLAERPVSSSLAGHAPHTTSPSLLKELKKRASSENLPFSIHLAESDDEMAFIGSAKGEWADFLKSRGIDFSGWGLPANSPVRHLSRHGILDEKTLVVHMLHYDETDLEILSAAGCAVCLCPRSNFNLHGRLPDAVKMKAEGINLCLGSDSLASAQSLNMFDEMRTAGEAFSGLSPVEIIAMATVNGARALGFGEVLGTLEKGKSSDFIYAGITGSSRTDVLEQLVFSLPDAIVRCGNF